MMEQSFREVEVLSGKGIHLVLFIQSTSSMQNLDKPTMEYNGLITF